MTEAQIADGLQQHALRLPGTLEQNAPFPAGKESECIEKMVSVMRRMQALGPAEKRKLIKRMDETERDIGREN